MLIRIFCVLSAIVGVGCPISDAKTAEQAALEQFDAAEETPVGVIGARFARHLVARDFEDAAEMLAPALRHSLSPMELESKYEATIEYAGALGDSVQPVMTMTDWPGKRPNDQGWVYVAISGPGFSEAVTLIVTNEGQIREIEWGRP
jgi:hypothetical protein